MQNHVLRGLALDCAAVLEDTTGKVSVRELCLDGVWFPALSLGATTLPEKLYPYTAGSQSISPLLLVQSPGSTKLLETPRCA